MNSSPRMMSLWQNAIGLGKAWLLDQIELGPDELLERVEEFESVSQVTEHSYPALILSSKVSVDSSRQPHGDTKDEDYSEDGTYPDKFDDTFESLESSVPFGSLPIDLLAEQLSDTDADEYF